MRVYRLEYLQDAEHRDHHLDRDIDGFDLDKYPGATQNVVRMLQRVSIGAPAGFSVVAAVAVKTIVLEVQNWHMGDHAYFDVKPGMLVFSDNHIAIWLRDLEARARYVLASVSHTELFDVCGRGSESALRALITEKINDAARAALLKRHDAFEAALGELQKIQDEQVLFQDVLNSC